HATGERLPRRAGLGQPPARSADPLRGGCRAVRVAGHRRLAMRLPFTELPACPPEAQGADVQARLPRTGRAAVPVPGDRLCPGGLAGPWRQRVVLRGDGRHLDLRQLLGAQDLGAVAVQIGEGPWVCCAQYGGQSARGSQGWYGWHSKVIRREISS